MHLEKDAKILQEDPKFLTRLNHAIDTDKPLKDDRATYRVFVDPKVMGHEGNWKHDSSDTDTPFHLQGDAEFNQASMLEKRENLRKEQGVCDQIDRYWTMFAKLEVASEENITEKEYCDILLLIYKVLRQDFNYYEAEYQVKEDWYSDNAGEEYMRYNSFFNALFELVDLWTCDVAPETYESFLKLLLDRISIQVVIFLDGSVLKLSIAQGQRQKAIRSAIPLSTIRALNYFARPLRAKRKIKTLGQLAQLSSDEVEQTRSEFALENKLESQKIGQALEHFTQCLSTIGSVESLADIDEDAIQQYRSAFIENQQLDPIKQTEVSRIDAELQKLGLFDAKHYNSLHSLFFTATESEIQSQAKQVDQKLVIELQKVGVDCTDKSPMQVRLMYNEMFHQLIESTGHDISTTASTLLEEMEQNPDLCLEYIESRGELLKSIDEVEAFGTLEEGGQETTIAVQEPEKPATPKRIKPPNRPQLLLYGVQQDGLEPVKRYIALLGLGDIQVTAGIDDAHEILAKEAEYYDLVNFDAGVEANIALTQLEELHRQVGKRIIFLGGNIDSETLAQCQTDGLLYFAAKSIDFKQLANAIVKYYEANGISYRKWERRTSVESGNKSKSPPRRRSLEQPRESPRQRKLNWLSNLFKKS